jgi:predicted transposase YbfD/YdcC
MANQNTEFFIKQNVLFLKHFSTLEDPRRTNKGHFYYPLNEILFLVISAVVSGFTDWTSIQIFGNAKLDWLRHFFPYTHGIPSHDVIGKLFSRLDPLKFNECFLNWVNSISELTNGEVVAIDGKTICGSGDSEKVHSAIHVVSAYAAGNRLCLGQVTVDQKQNEIVAIPEILDLLSLQGCIVTIDAMGCQKEIASKIIEGKADYVLMAKDNQKELKSQVEKMFRLQKDCPKTETLDTGHGRIETRTCQVINDLTFMDDKEQWPGLRSIIQVKSQRCIKKTGKTSEEVRYYISSLDTDPATMNQVIRSHWGVENKLHWVLDVIFNEDKSLKKKDNAAVNLNMITKIALALIEKDQSFKASKKGRRERAALDDQYREKILKC